jgi:hypothetical protein
MNDSRKGKARRRKRRNIVDAREKCQLALSDFSPFAYFLSKLRAECTSVQLP